MSRRLLTAVLLLLFGVAAVPSSASLDGVASLVSAAATQQDPAALTVYITRTGEKYHRDGCRYLSRSKIAISLKEATARGYGPCSVCKPPVAK